MTIDHSNKCDRFNSLAQWKIWRSTAVLDDAAKAAAEVVERFAELVEEHATTRAADNDHWKRQYDRLAIMWNQMATTLAANGWTWDESAQQYRLLDENREQCQRCAIAAWNAGSERRVGEVSAVEGQRRSREELLAAGHSHRHVDHVSH